MTRSIVRTRRCAGLLLALAMVPSSLAAQAAAQTAASPAPAPTATPGPPQIAFPGQYAASPAEWRYPVFLSGCRRFSGEERIACAEFVASDHGTLGRFRAANAALGPKKPGETRAVFFGDSITDNWSKAGYGGFFPGRPYVNRGIGGQTTSQMLVRFRADVLDIDPDVVLVLAGTNDVSANNGPVTDDDLKRNFMTMAELAKAHGVRIVFASILPVADDKRGPDGQPLVRTEGRPPARLRGLNAWLSDYARRNGHVYLDYASAVSDAAGAFKADLNSDGLHPNAAGYAVMAPLAEKAIAEAMRARP